ncbi:50S ribosomal protein L2 [Candidatus Dojkabacteria bacterium]|nr:50S ribosomal protein L2 [Candidatus Dojkabacteria bacterium]
MALKKYKPTSPGRRHKVAVHTKDLSKEKPLKRLTVGKKNRAGRNSQGRITVRHRGGGAKRNYRIVDFKRKKFGISAKVETIEYDPNRGSNIARILYADGERSYILAPDALKVGDNVISGEDVEIRIGNTCALKQIPSGTMVHNVEVMPGAGGKLAKAAGSGLTVRGNNGKGYVIVKLSSGEVRLLNENCLATIGIVSNPDKLNVVLGKAGTSRHLGRRPEVRGVAMHAVEHPHGGGEGRNGFRVAKDIWGHKVGVKTRKNKRTQKFIIKRRPVKRDKK